MILLTDVDDVLLEYGDSFMAYYGLNSYDINSMTLEDSLGVSKGDFLDMVNEFNHSLSFKFIPPTMTAVAGIAEFKKRNIDIVAITACGDSPKTKSLRVANLKEIFGDVFTKIHCVPVGDSKFDILRQYTNHHSDVVWVEDSEQHYHTGKLLGYESYLIKTKYNSPSSNIKNIVHNWNEITKQIGL